LVRENAHLMLIKYFLTSVSFYSQSINRGWEDEFERAKRDRVKWIRAKWASCLSTLAKNWNCGPDLPKEVKEVLRSSGLFLIEGAVEGKSGVLHVFDAAAKEADGRLVVVDIAHSDEDEAVDEIPLLRFYVKCFDTDSEKRILLCIPRATENVKKLAPVFSIKIVECRDPREASEGLRTALSERKE